MRAGANPEQTRSKPGGVPEESRRKAGAVLEDNWKIFRHGRVLLFILRFGLIVEL